MVINWDELPDLPDRCVLCGTLSNLISVDVLTPETDEFGDVVGYSILPDYYMCKNHALEYNSLSSKYMVSFADTDTDFDSLIVITPHGNRVDDVQGILDGISKTNAYMELFVKYGDLKLKNIVDEVNRQYKGGD